MVDQDPGTGELQRLLQLFREDMREQFRQTNDWIDRLVTTDAFVAEQRRVDETVASLRTAISDERAARIAALADEKTSREKGDQGQQTQLDRLTTNVRWVATSILMPTGLFLANLIISSRGGL